MPADPNEERSLREINRQLAEQVDRLSAQKLKLATWLVKALLLQGGTATLSNHVLLSRYHLKTLHVCPVGLEDGSHSGACLDTLEIHSGPLGICEDGDCVRMRTSLPMQDGTLYERTQALPPGPTGRPVGSDVKAGMRYSQQMADAELWQHPERN